MSIVYPETPSRVPRDKVLEAMRSLGFNAADIRSLTVGRSELVVELYIVNERGEKFAPGESCITVHLPVVD